MLVGYHLSVLLIRLKISSLIISVVVDKDGLVLLDWLCKLRLLHYQFINRCAVVLIDLLLLQVVMLLGERVLRNLFNYLVLDLTVLTHFSNTGSGTTSCRRSCHSGVCIGFACCTPWSAAQRLLVFGNWLDLSLTSCCVLKSFEDLFLHSGQVVCQGLSTSFLLSNHAWVEDWFSWIALEVGSRLSLFAVSVRIECV